MGREKQLQNRLQVIKSIQKITQAMKMVAVAKLEKTKKKHRHTNLCIESFTNILQYTWHASYLQDYFTERPAKRYLYVLLTSDKGLCGTYNNAIFEKVKEVYNSTVSKAAISFLPIGKKGYEFLKRENYPYENTYVDLHQDPTFENVAELQRFLTSCFLKDTDRVFLIYQPRSQGTIATVEQLFPMIPFPKTFSKKEKMILEPNADHIVTHVFPRLLTLQLFEKILKAQLAEQSQRMLSMSQATENASDMLKELNITYNRLRQATITKGIIEVVAGLES